MVERYMSKEQSEEFNKHLEDFHIHLKKAVKEYSDINNFSDVTVVTVVMATVIKEMCNTIRKNNVSGGLDLEKHAVEVFSNMIKHGIWTNGGKELQIKKTRYN